MFLFVVTMFFNGGLIPTYLLMKDLHITNTIWVFIVPFCVNVFYLIIARTFFESSLPPELYEAAMMDGCSHFKYFVKVALPLSKAMISVIALYYLVGHWNDFFTALVYIRDNNLQPLQIVLRDILLSNQAFQNGAGTGGAMRRLCAALRGPDQIRRHYRVVAADPRVIPVPAKILRKRRHDRFGQRVRRKKVARSPFVFTEGQLFFVTCVCRRYASIAACAAYVPTGKRPGRSQTPTRP